MASVLVKLVIALIVLGYVAASIRRFLRFANDDEGRSRTATAGNNFKERRYRKILGLRGNETAEQIKKSYRKLIAEYHPDKVQRMAPEIRRLAEKRTAELTEAYNYLKKKERQS